MSFPPGDLAGFAKAASFPLDPFQLQACKAVERGENVLVSAPTGSGKTLVGEFAIAHVRSHGNRAFYTTPLKALSNQKYEDLCAVWGKDEVGLLTGDISLNGDAPIVVMTTEILRNMIYASSPAIESLETVVLDEVHYLADPLRGPIWEEIVITAPERVGIVALSATVANAEEVGDWLRSVRGPTAVVSTSHRPVPLYNHVLYNGRLFDLLAADGSSLNPAIARQQLIKDHRRARPLTRSRADVVAQLDKAGLLPAIYFIFSRAGCEAAAQQCIAAGVRLVPPAVGKKNLEVLRDYCRDVPRAELDALGYGLISAAIQQGFAPHHAGLLPAFRLTVEKLFAAGGLRTVFATETLALGINMPARTVVLDRLDKWNGQSHEDLTPGEYIQLTGRAGRRGIDIEGHAVISSSGQARPKKQLALVTAKPGPLRSAFRPSYNMAVNLLAERTRSQAHAILSASFAQFQADRSVVGLAAQVRRFERELEPLEDELRCDLGDIGAYFAMRSELSELEALASREAAGQRASDKDDAVARLRPGDVIWVPRGRWKGIAVVLDARWDGRGRFPRRQLLLESGDVRAVEVRQLAYPFVSLGSVRLRKSFNPRVPGQRRDALSAARELTRGRSLEAPPRERPTERAEQSPAQPEALGPRIDELRASLRAHPCHACPDMAAHEAVAHRLRSLRVELDRARARIEEATDSLSTAFDRICDVLHAEGFLVRNGEHAERPTADGERLRRIYGDNDLLVAIAVREDAFGAGLSPEELAGLVSGLVVERRGEDKDARPRGPLPAQVRAAIGHIEQLNLSLTRREAAAGRPPRRPLDFTLARSIISWLQGLDLAAVLAGADVSPGDFLRAAQQLEDLLGQLRRLDLPESRAGALRLAHTVVREKLAAFRR